MPVCGRQRLRRQQGRSVVVRSASHPGTGPRRIAWDIGAGVRPQLRPDRRGAGCHQDGGDPHHDCRATDGRGQARPRYQPDPGRPERRPAVEADGPQCSRRRLCLLPSQGAARQRHRAGDRRMLGERRSGEGPEDRWRCHRGNALCQSDACHHGGRDWLGAGEHQKIRALARQWPDQHRERAEGPLRFQHGYCHHNARATADQRRQGDRYQPVLGGHPCLSASGAPARLCSSGRQNSAPCQGQVPHGERGRLQADSGHLQRRGSCRHRRPAAHADVSLPS